MTRRVLGLTLVSVICLMLLCNQSVISQSPQQVGISGPEYLEAGETADVSKLRSYNVDDPDREKRIQWWKEARFGIFAHFNCYGNYITAKSIKEIVIIYN